MKNKTPDLEDRLGIKKNGTSLSPARFLSRSKCDTRSPWEISPENSVPENKKKLICLWQEAKRVDLPTHTVTDSVRPGISSRIRPQNQLERAACARREEDSSGGYGLLYAIRSFLFFLLTVVACACCFSSSWGWNRNKRRSR